MTLPTNIEVSRFAECDKMKVWGDFMYFISYLTDVLTMTNFFALPPNF